MSVSDVSFPTQHTNLFLCAAKTSIKTFQLQMPPFYYLKQVKLETNENVTLSRPFECCVHKLENRLEKISDSDRQP